MLRSSSTTRMVVMAASAPAARHPAWAAWTDPIVPPMACPAPATRARRRRGRPLAHLGRPVEADSRIVVGDAVLVGVGRIVGLGGVVEQQDRLVAEHAVA